MITAAVTNSNLIIYSSSVVTGINTNYLFVFDNNVFRAISSSVFSSNQINIQFYHSISPGDVVSVAVYPGGIITSNSGLSTSIIASNSTIFKDNYAPALYEILQQNNYNFTSFVYSNFVTGISTESNFPSTNVILKRQPPQGAITINEGYLGPMKVHRFAALSNKIFEVGAGATSFTVSKFFAFDYNSFGGQNIGGISFLIQPSIGFSSNAKAYLTINEDYFGNPSSNVIGVSTTLDFSNISAPIYAIFTFSELPYISEGKYWFIFKPTDDSSISSTNQIKILEATENNLYTTELLSSPDGVVYSSTGSFGNAIKVYTDRGIVLPTADAVYNQLNQPQSIIVNYGDLGDLNSYTNLAVPTTSHYIKKNFLDNNLVYAIETLIGSNGQNQYEILGLTTTDIVYYSMISNPLTTNVVRYELFTPLQLNDLSLKSLGDYYAKSSIGKVLVSASDFLGVATVEISTSSSFPINATTVVNPSNSPQNYIDNIDFDFGGVGKKFIALNYQIGGSIKYIYPININNSIAYLVISDTNVYIYDLTSVSNIFTLSDTIFTSSAISAEGILLTDTGGNIYNYSNLSIVQVGSINYIPTCSVLASTVVYIGISTIHDVTKISNRKRIFSFTNNIITHQAWSTQIPEPEITFLYYTSFGLIIGSFDQINNIGKIYSFYNSILTQLYSTYLRPDAAYFSTLTNTLYVALSGSQIVAAVYSLNTLGNFSDTTFNISGSLVKQITSTKENGKIIVITDINSYIFDEINLTVILLSNPIYSINDQNGLLVKVENNDLGIKDLESTYKLESFSNINFDSILSGYSSNIKYSAEGFIVFGGNLGVTTSFYLQTPINSTIDSITFDNQPISLVGGIFTQSFLPNVARQFSLKISGQGIIGVGTIALYNGLGSNGAVVGISSFVAPKILNWYLKTGNTDDIFAYSDGSLREANVSDITSNFYTVYARFTDINGNISSGDNLATDIIYSQTQQQANNQALPSGRIVEINPNTNVNNLSFFIPSEGVNGLVYSGTKIVRAVAVFESDPYFASDVTTWNQIQVLTQIPGFNQIPDAGNEPEYGTSVTLYVKTAVSLTDLENNSYINSYNLSTINNGVDYQSQFISILANIASLSGQWLQFKIELKSASLGIAPIVKSVLITYNGAGTSKFVTKTFNVNNQTNITPTPQFRRGILTANFVTNGGQIFFGYTTDPNNSNPSNYIQITPNQIFTLSTPSDQIKFGVILKSATSLPCFFDEFAIQMDLGPNNVYFMPPQSAFEIQKYINSSGIAVTHGYQFVNKSIGIVSSYNWSFGTSYPIGISTFIPPNEDGSAGPAVNRQNPIVVFNANGPQTVGIFITGWVENSVIYNSEIYSKTFIST